MLCGRAGSGSSTTESFAGGEDDDFGHTGMTQVKQVGTVIMPFYLRPQTSNEACCTEWPLVDNSEVESIHYMY